MDAAAAVRLELQEFRAQTFEDSEALRFQHEQALDSLTAENERLQHAAHSSQSAQAVVEQRLHKIELELADAASRLEVAQIKLSEQTAACSRAQAREAELQSITRTQLQEISALQDQHSASLIAFQQRERDWEDKIQSNGTAHSQELGDLRSQIAILSADVQRYRSASSSLQQQQQQHQEEENLRSACNSKLHDDYVSAAAEATKLRSLLQELSENAAVSLSKLQSECSVKEQELAAARHELVASQAAVTEANLRESNLNSQLQSLQAQLSQTNIQIQDQKNIMSSPAPASLGDSTALELCNRRVADMERKCETARSAL
jgi:chromosome segregation ATPase